MDEQVRELHWQQWCIGDERDGFKISNSNGSLTSKTILVATDSCIHYLINMKYESAGGDFS